MIKDNDNEWNKIVGFHQLHVAVADNDLEKIKVLLEKECVDVNIISNYGHTALHIAEFLDNKPIIDYLRSRPKINTNIVNSYYYTPEYYGKLGRMLRSKNMIDSCLTEEILDEFRFRIYVEQDFLDLKKVFLNLKHDIQKFVKFGEEIKYCKEELERMVDISNRKRKRNDEEQPGPPKKKIKGDSINLESLFFF